jgi:hypothetical protein
MFAMPICSGITPGRGCCNPLHPQAARDCPYRWKWRRVFPILKGSLDAVYSAGNDIGGAVERLRSHCAKRSSGAGDRPAGSIRRRFQRMPVKVSAGQSEDRHGEGHLHESGDEHSSPNYALSRFARIADGDQHDVTERVQNGQMTIAQANEAIAQKFSELNAEEQRRLLASRSVGAQESAAAAAWQASRPRTCMGGPNIVGCF